MSRWDGIVTRTAEDAGRFWANASLETLNAMMAPPSAWAAWLRVAAAVITEPGSVFEPGSGVGLLVDALPPGCTYYGCDVNAAFVEEARRQRSGPGIRFDNRDLYEVLDAGERFDWVVATSLFGMFPEEESYGLIRRLWDITERGMSVTTVNKRLFPSHRLLRFEFTSHDPDELLAAARALPDVEEVVLRHGREFPEFRGHYWRRGLALYCWKNLG